MTRSNITVSLIKLLAVNLRDFEGFFLQNFIKIRAKKLSTHQKIRRKECHYILPRGFEDNINYWPQSSDLLVYLYAGL